MTAPMLFLLCAAVLLVGTALLTAVLIRRGERPRRERSRDAPLPQPADATAASAQAPVGTSSGGDGDRLRTVLLSRMSHDLRSPLNSVITLSQLLTDGNAGPLSAEQRS